MAHFFSVRGQNIFEFRPPRHRVPEKHGDHFLPEKAVYRYIYEDIMSETELFVSAEGGDVVCSVKLTNIAGKELSAEAFAQVFPLIAPVNLSGWDKPEWYVRTSVHHDERKISCFTAG